MDVTITEIHLARALARLESQLELAEQEIVRLRQVIQQEAIYTNQERQAVSLVAE